MNWKVAGGSSTYIEALLPHDMVSGCLSVRGCFLSASFDMRVQHMYSTVSSVFKHPQVETHVDTGKCKWRIVGYNMLHSADKR